MKKLLRKQVKTTANVKNLLNFLIFTLFLWSTQTLQAQSSTWNGSVSSDWFTAANWSNGVPDANTTIALISAAPNPCIIDSGQTATTRSVIVSGGTLTIESNALLDLDNAVGSGFRNDASGTFNNNGTLMVDNVSAGGGDLGFGFSMSSSTNNFGSILIGTDGGNIESTFKLNLEGGTFTNEGALTVEDGGISFFIRVGSFVNAACGQMIGEGAFYTSVNATITNAGYAKFTSFTNNGSTFTNNGIVEDTNNIFNTNAQTINNAIIVEPISSPNCSNDFANAVQNVTPNNFSIGTTWYSDATLSTTAGTYNAATNVFTANTGTPSGANTFFFDITDNANTCSHTVSVAATYNGDNTPPEITCPANITVDNDPGVCVANVTYTTPIGTDNCPSPTTTQTQGIASGNAFPVGVTTNTFEVTDGTQTADCSFTVTVSDVEVPVLSTCQTDITTNATAGNCDAVVTFDPPTATDNCTIGVQGMLATAYDSNNGQRGVMFDIAAVNTLTVSKFDANLYASTTGNYEIYYKPGTFQGSENNAGAWTLVGSATAVTSLGINVPTPLPIPVNVTIPAGQTYGFYITNDFGAGTSYTDINSATNSLASNADMTITGGIGKSYPFGLTFNFRAFNGTVHYGSEISITQTQGGASGSSFSVGTTPVSYLVSDGSGNSVNCDFDVTVNENEVPQINCPANISVNTDAGNCNAIVNYTAPIGTDNCTPTTTQTTGLASGATYPTGTTVNTFEVTDGTQTANCSFNIVVTDNEAPQISCPANISVNTDAGNCNAVVNYTAPVGTDNCTPPTTTQTAGLASGATYPTGTTVNTFEVTDGTQTANCSFNVVVTDNEAPQISCPANININTDAGNCNVVVNYTAPVGTDNCTPTTTQTAGLASGVTYPTGTTVNTFEVTDGTQTANCSFNVVVTDNEAPQIACPANISINTDAGNCNAVVNYTTPVGTDNCTPTTTQTAGLVSGATYPTGTTVNTFEVTDGTQTANCSFNIVVTDNENPVAVCQNTNIQLNANNSASLTAAQIDGGSTDDCSVSVSIPTTTFDCDDVGTPQSVILTATDTNNNTHTCTAIVTVLDDTNPCCPFTNQVYVDIDATGNNDGTTWANAFNDLQNALDEACPTTTEIWVAEGTYLPTETVRVNQVNNRQKSFHWNRNLQLYGGFTGTETMRSERTPAANATILSGNIGASGVSDNSYHVIVFNGANASVLDGFTVEGGRANAALAYQYGGGQVLDNYGSGIITHSAALTVRNCIIQNNFTGQIGGGIAVWNNTLTVDKTIFRNNTAAAGGGIGTNFGTINVSNSLFESNAGGNAGGGITARFSSNLNAVNVTFDKNTSNNGQAIYSEGTSVSNLTNCIIRDFTKRAGSGTINIKNSNVLGSNGSGATWNINRGNDLGGNIDTNPLFVDAANSDYTLISCSPSINTGDNAANATTEDLAGNQRVFETMIDMGAYEFQDIKGDFTNPVALCQNITVQLDADGNGSTTAAAVNNGSNDICGEVTLSLSQTNFDCSSPESNTVTLIVTDESNNESTCSATVTLEDNIAPVAICPSAPTIQLGSDGVGFILNNGLTNGTSTDNCSVTQSSSFAVFGCEDVGIPQTVVLTATDGSGNISTADCTVNVIDVTAPAIPTYEVTLELDETGNASITAAELGAGSTDACGVGTMEITGGSLDLDAATFGCNSVGESTIELTVTDINGNSRVRDITVTIIDNSPAEIECRQPVSTTVTPGMCERVDLTVLPPFVLSDNCGIGPGTNISRTPAINDFPIGTTVLTWTVTDSNGNLATCESLVIIEDNQAPVLHNYNTYIEFLEPNTCLAQVTITVDATDNCGDVTIDGGGIFMLPFGIHTETITVMDENGNITQEEIIIYVHDDQAPDLVFCPEDIEIIANQDANTIDLPEPIFTDNCGIDALTNDAPVMFTESTTTVIWTAQDTYGNTTECSYDVTVTPSIFFVGEEYPIEASTETESSMVTWNRPEAITHCEACLLTDMPDFVFLGEFEGHQYFLYPNATNWTDAVVLSEEINAQLVTINDVRENDFIQNQLPQTGEEVQYWTGLNYQNYDFAWLTDAAFDYGNFGFDPVLNFNVINAGTMNSDGTWTMMTADMQNGFLAERPCLDITQIAPIIETEDENGELIETLLTPDADWAAGAYTVIYEATDMCDSTATFSFGVTVQEPTAVYCETSGLDQEVWLERVVFNDYLNESENNAGYADFTEETVELVGENSLNIQLIPGGIDLTTNAPPLYWRIFADWNADGDFFDADEILHEQTSTNVVNLDFPALLNEEDFTVRLRIAVAQGNYPEACADYTTGEAEDYALFFPAVEITEEGTDADFVSIYPNPANDYVTIDLSDFASNVSSISITNQLGKTQFTQPINATKQQNLRIDLQDLRSGMYFLNVTTQNGEVISKSLVIAKLGTWSVQK